MKKLTLKLILILIIAIIIALIFKEYSNKRELEKMNCYIEKAKLNSEIYDLKIKLKKCENEIRFYAYY